ncbi:hypothetical protein [Sphingobium subterraneum]|uniref:hypothetical protein n=1 Tax=Sphingobium subterraneum TaxID=627688 RepID=UPI001611541F|nr:hypothetical protein [Sphingobium subterraneum]
MPRIDSIAPDRGAVRTVAPVVSVQAGGASAQSGQDLDTEARNEQARQEHMASASDYAKVQARVADILSRLNADKVPSAESVERADAQIGSMIPPPVVVVPLFPASREMIEHALAVAHDIAEQAMLAQAAQANVNVGTVEQVLA